MRLTEAMWFILTWAMVSAAGPAGLMWTLSSKVVHSG